MTKTIKNKIYSVFLIVLLLFEFFFSTLSVFADSGDKSIEETTVEEDLKEINLSGYGANPNGKCDLLYFAEYGYSEDKDYSKAYNLYFYVYNPTQTDISKASGLNKVNMTVKYGVADSSKNENVPLECVSVSSNNLFIKFRLEQPEKVLEYARAYAADHEGVRRYEITGLQIRPKGANLATDYPVSKVYDYSGYAANLGPNASSESTLECKDYGLRSIHLSLQDTYYRFSTQSDGVTQDTLNSVYFEIPLEYFNEFGNLNNISAEWYERQTKPIFVTSELGAYESLRKLLGITVTDQTSEYQVFWDEVEYKHDSLDMLSYPTFKGALFTKYKPGELIPTSDLWPVYYLHPNAEVINELYWLFHKEGTKTEDFMVSSEELKNHIESYKLQHPEALLLLEKYPKDMFELLKNYDRYGAVNYEDENGLVKRTFNIDGNGYTYVDNVENQSKWNEIWFGTKYKDYTYSPIQTISKTDLSLSAEAFSEIYLVDKKDAQKFLDNAKSAYDSGKVPVLLRHAVTDYTSYKARFDALSNDAMSETDGYVAQQTVFLDFDVISLGFKDVNGYNDVVIGVVANPIDIINDITAPENFMEQEWWQRLYALLLIIVFVVIFMFCWPFLSSFFKMAFDVIWTAIKFVLGAVWWVIRLPFRLFRRR